MNASRYFATLARYNLWATRRLYDHLDTLEETDYRRDAHLFFKSIHGTLSHLLVAEHTLWFNRFAFGASPAARLSDEQEPDRARLRQRLIDGAARWIALVESWPAERFDGGFDYTTTQGVAVSLPFAPTLAHVFNHGTHHRGQITAALTAMGQAGPELDLVWMLQAESTAA